MSEVVNLNPDLLVLNDISDLTTLHEKPWGQTLEDGAQLVLDIHNGTPKKDASKVLHWATALTVREAIQPMRDFVDNFDAFVFDSQGRAFVSINSQAHESGLDAGIEDAIASEKMINEHDWDEFSRAAKEFARVDAKNVSGEGIILTCVNASDIKPGPRGYRLLGFNHFGLLVAREVSFLELPVVELLERTMTDTANIEDRLKALDSEAMKHQS